MGRLVVLRNDQIETAQTVVRTIRKSSLLLWVLVVATGGWLAGCSRPARAVRRRLGRPSRRPRTG